MQKEEFPTFLNEQPKVVFGRTTRELLIMMLGCVAGYLLWENVRIVYTGEIWFVFSTVLAFVPVIISLVIALVPIASRSMEEWIFCWFMYITTPKIYLYKPEAEWGLESESEENEQLSQLPREDEDLEED